MSEKKTQKTLHQKLFDLQSEVGAIAKDSKLAWIKDHEGRYAVSDTGKIYSLYKNGKCIEMKQATQRDGYHLIRLYKNSKIFDRLVSRIVANHFVDNPNDYKEVNHIDGDKSNNHAENLEWCTRSQNIQHSFDTGIRTASKGEQVATSKLSKLDVLDIRNTYNLGGISQSEIARAYNVTPSNIYYIVNNLTWTHL